MSEEFIFGSKPNPEYIELIREDEEYDSVLDEDFGKPFWDFGIPDDE